MKFSMKYICQSSCCTHIHTHTRTHTHTNLISLSVNEINNWMGVIEWVGWTIQRRQKWKQGLMTLFGTTKNWWVTFLLLLLAMCLMALDPHVTKRLTIKPQDYHSHPSIESTNNKRHTRTPARHSHGMGTHMRYWSCRTVAVGLLA